MWKGQDAKLVLCRNNQRLEPGVSQQLPKSEREEIRAALASRSTLPKLPLYYQTVDRTWRCPRTALRHGAEQSAEKARLSAAASATLLHLPDTIYSKIITALFASYDESKHVNLSSFSLMDGLVFPQSSFISLKEITAGLNGALLSCKTLRKDVIIHLCRHIQFHVTVSSISNSRKSLRTNTFMTPYLRRVKHLRLEINLERLGGESDNDKILKLYALRSNLLEFATKLKRDDSEPLELHIVLRRRAGIATSKSKLQPGPQLLSVSTKESSLPVNVLNAINVLTSLKPCISSLRVSGLSLDHTTDLMQSFFNDLPGITSPYQPTPAISCSTSRISHQQLYLRATIGLNKVLAKPLLVGPNPYSRKKECITKDTSVSSHNNIRSNVRLPVFPGKIDSKLPRPQLGRATVNIIPRPKSKNRITRSVSDPLVRRDFKHLERSKIGTTRKIWKLSHSECKIVWNSAKRNRYLFRDAKVQSPFIGRTHPRFTRLDAKSFAATIRPLTPGQTRPKRSLKKSRSQSAPPRSNISSRHRRHRRRAARPKVDNSAPPVPPLPDVIPSRPIKEYLGCISPATKNLTSTYIPAAGFKRNRRISNVNSGDLKGQDVGDAPPRPRTPLRSPLRPSRRAIATADTPSIASVLNAPIKLVKRGSIVPSSVSPSTNSLLRVRSPSFLNPTSKKIKYTHDTTFAKTFTATLEKAPTSSFVSPEQADGTEDATSPSPSLRLFNFEIPIQKDVSQYEEDEESFSSTRTFTQAIYNAHQAQSNLNLLEQNESHIFGQTFIASYQEDSLQEGSILGESTYEGSIHEQPDPLRSYVVVNKSAPYDNAQTFAASYQEDLVQHEPIWNESIYDVNVQEQSHPPNSHDNIEQNTEFLEENLERHEDIEDILEGYSRNESYDCVDESFDSQAVETGCQSYLPHSPSGYENFLDSYLNTVDASATTNDTYFMQDINELQTSCAPSVTDRDSPPKHHRSHAIDAGSASRNFNSSVGSLASEKRYIAYKEDAAIDVETIPWGVSANRDEHSSQQRSAIKKIRTEPWPSFEPVTGHEDHQSPYKSPCELFDIHRRRHENIYPVRGDSLAAKTKTKPDKPTANIEQRVKSKTSVPRPVDEGGYPDLIQDMRLRAATEATHGRDTPNRIIQLNAPQEPSTSFTVEDLHELQAISSILPQTPNQASDARSTKQEKSLNSKRKLTLGKSIRKFSKTLSLARSSGSNDTCDTSPLPVDLVDWCGTPHLPESCERSANAARQRRVAGTYHAFEAEEFTDNELYNASPIIESPVPGSNDQGTELHWFSRSTDDKDEEKLLSFADFLTSAPRYRASFDDKSNKQILPTGIDNPQRAATLDHEAKSMKSRSSLEQPVQQQKTNPLGKLAKALELDKLQQALKKKDILELMVGTAQSP